MDLIIYTDSETIPSVQCLCKRHICSITQMFARSSFEDIEKFRNADSEVLVTIHSCLVLQLPPKHKF